MTKPLSDEECDALVRDTLRTLGADAECLAEPVTQLERDTCRYIHAAGFEAGRAAVPQDVIDTFRLMDRAIDAAPQLPLTERTPGELDRWTDAIITVMKNIAAFRLVYDHVTMYDAATGQINESAANSPGQHADDRPPAALSPSSAAPDVLTQRLDAWWAHSNDTSTLIRDARTALAAYAKKWSDAIAERDALTQQVKRLTRERDEANVIMREIMDNDRIPWGSIQAWLTAREGEGK